MDKHIKISVIGAGLRCKNVLQNLLFHNNDQIEIAAVFDPDTAVAENLLNTLHLDNVKVCRTDDEAINFPGVEWVMVFSPNSFHREHIIKSFEANKHVFAEKPLAISIEDCQAINEAQKRSGKIFATGFVLRYTPIYRKVKEILDSGKLGPIMSIEANENIPPEHGGYIMTNWRRLRKFSGPHILEKCCHDLNLIEWFTGSLPCKVYASAARMFFTPENAFLMQKHPKETFTAWSDPHRIDSPFSGDTDLDDVLFSVAEFRNGIRVSFNASMANVLPERRMRFNCQYGTLVVEFYSMTVRYRILGEDEEHLHNFPQRNGHGGGDFQIMKDLLQTMVDHTPPECSGGDGLTSAVYALALDLSAHKNEVIDLEDTWKKLGR